MFLIRAFLRSGRSGSGVCGMTRRRRAAQPSSPEAIAARRAERMAGEANERAEAGRIRRTPADWGIDPAALKLEAANDVRAVIGTRGRVVQARRDDVFDRLAASGGLSVAQHGAARRLLLRPRRRAVNPGIHPGACTKGNTTVGGQTTPFFLTCNERALGAERPVLLSTSWGGVAKRAGGASAATKTSPAPPASSNSQPPGWIRRPRWNRRHGGRGGGEKSACPRSPVSPFPSRPGSRERVKL